MESPPEPFRGTRRILDRGSLRKATAQVSRQLVVSRQRQEILERPRAQFFQDGRRLWELRIGPRGRSDGGLHLAERLPQDRVAQFCGHCAAIIEFGSVMDPLPQLSTRNL